MSKLIPLPAFQDDYLWFMHDRREALVVDPGDAVPVMAYLQREVLQLQAILVTRTNSPPSPGKPGCAVHMNTH